MNLFKLFTNSTSRIRVSNIEKRYVDLIILLQKSKGRNLTSRELQVIYSFDSDQLEVVKGWVS